ncbi:ArsR/SmtB family transcription factor [Mucilaginibacter sp. SJ]|uniref:ArsR/SmtB family transcription factor n=1 Tax=Mucilaginibacter sp. SJ TaxID=3029053 RepID=UPI0023A91C97|nr:metalloregulator ArsR/SmtB family transcription factor [Mucilaginibacter sp. SJ]WEA00880.1 metalloregulator ArsR/SmtB family transcription factor [Mucilaginibacter sp. SJ]
MEQHRLDVFQVIADPSRRQILHLLSKDSSTINALAENFDMSRPAVSKHIKVLYNAGFISIQDIGRERHCVLKQDGFKELQAWLAYYDKFWGDNLDKLGALMNDKMNKK